VIRKLEEMREKLNLNDIVNNSNNNILNNSMIIKNNNNNNNNLNNNYNINNLNDNDLNGNDNNNDLNKINDINDRYDEKMEIINPESSDLFKQITINDNNYEKEITLIKSFNSEFYENLQLHLNQYLTSCLNLKSNNDNNNEIINSYGGPFVNLFYLNAPIFTEFSKKIVENNNILSFSELISRKLAILCINLNNNDNYKIFDWKELCEFAFCVIIKAFVKNSETAHIDFFVKEIISEGKKFNLRRFFEFKNDERIINSLEILIDRRKKKENFDSLFFEQFFVETEI